MNTIPAAEPKTNFGALIEKAQREPVTISRNGRDVAVIMSAVAYAEHQRIKLELLRQEVRKGLDEAARGDVVSTETAFTEMDRELVD